MHRAHIVIRRWFPVLLISVAFALVLPGDANAAPKKKAKTAAAKKGKAAKPTKKAKAAAKPAKKAVAKAAPAKKAPAEKAEERAPAEAPQAAAPRAAAAPVERAAAPADGEAIRRHEAMLQDLAMRVGALDSAAKRTSPMDAAKPRRETATSSGSVVTSGLHWLGLLTEMAGVALFLLAMLAPKLRDLAKAGSMILVGGIGLQAAAFLFGMGISSVVTFLGALLPLCLFGAYAALLTGRFPVSLPKLKFGRKKGGNVVDLSDTPKQTVDLSEPPPGYRNEGPPCDFCKKSVPLRLAEVWWRQRFNAAGEVAGEPTTMHYGHVECLDDSGKYQSADVTDSGADPVSVNKARAEVFLAHRLPELRAWYERSHSDGSKVDNENELKDLEDRIVSSIRKAA